MIHYRQLVSGGFNILKDFTANEVQLNYSSSMYWTDLTVGQVEYYKMGYMLLITTTFALFIGTIARVTRGYISMLVASGVVIGMPVILEIVNSLAWRFNFTAFPVQLISYFSPIGNINAFDRFLTHSNGVYLQNIEFISSGIWITIALVLTISLYTFHLTKEDIKT
jgi:hypothetical protein